MTNTISSCFCRCCSNNNSTVTSAITCYGNSSGIDLVDMMLMIPHHGVYVHTYRHTYADTHACMHAGLQAGGQTDIPIYTQTYIHTYIHTEIHTYRHTYINAYMRTCCNHDEAATIRALSFREQPKVTHKTVVQITSILQLSANCEMLVKPCYTPKTLSATWPKA